MLRVNEIYTQRKLTRAGAFSTFTLGMSETVWVKSIIQDSSITEIY